MESGSQQDLTMRDKWYLNLAVPWLRLSPNERGFCSTLHDMCGDSFGGDWDAFDAMFCNGWKTIADRLSTIKVISLETPSFGVHMVKLLLKNAKRREYHRNYKKHISAHVRTCTNHAKKD